MTVGPRTQCQNTRHAEKVTRVESALRCCLPLDLARYVIEIAASTRIQASARASFVRIRRLPMWRHGFEKTRFGKGTYQYTGSSFESDLEQWTASFRPGVYTVWIRTAHVDGTATNVGPEKMYVTPGGVCWSLFKTWEMYSLAFMPCHGRLSEYHIHVTHAVGDEND